MTKIFWTISLATLGAALGCDDVADSANDDRAAAADDGGDLDVDPGGGSGCGEDSADAAGCACTPGAPPRSCFTASAEGKSACSTGVQDCVTSGGGELTSSSWGPCMVTGGADADQCGSTSGEPDDCTGDDCKSGSGDENPGGDETDCCTDEVAACVDGGEPAAVCDLLDQRCHGGSCDGLTAMCDPTALPVSKSCARLYYACFGFRVNKCVRENYDNCMYTIGDASLCAAWDAACTAREAYCASNVGSYESPDYAYSYPCTDWGHIFDPCWAEYQACALDPTSCTSALEVCLQSLGDIYAPICSTEAPEGNDSEPDKP